jgi:hypothetical protein
LHKQIPPAPWFGGVQGSALQVCCSAADLADTLLIIAENSILFVFRIGKKIMFQAIGYERWRNIDLTGQIASIS